MSWFDLMNALFETGGSIAAWMNVREIYLDKQLKGVNRWSMFFFTAWAFWNLFYYLHLSQWFSLWAGMPLALADAAWFILLWKYRKNDKSS